MGLLLEECFQGRSLTDMNPLFIVHSVWKSKKGDLLNMRVEAYAIDECGKICTGLLG